MIPVVLLCLFTAVVAYTYGLKQGEVTLNDLIYRRGIECRRVPTHTNTGDVAQRKSGLVGDASRDSRKFESSRLRQQ